MRRAGSDENLTGKLKVPFEKHDVLFSKARYVLNQRHIKRPWFNLNPFLEKTDENIDLENFLPGESKYIQPLESLVLCESFHSDNPVDTREISIETFFEYLFSNEWEKGCSIRILEGQLLDQLLLGLYRLENEGIAVRHTTYAFAKNKRPRTGCYKLSKGSAGCIEETLLIEFAHFGRLTKDKPNETTLNAFEYLEHDPVDLLEIEETTDGTIPMLPVLTEIPNKRRDRTMSIGNARMQETQDTPKWGRSGSLMSKHIHAISFLKAIQSDNRRQSIVTPSLNQQSKRNSIATPLTGSRPKLSSGMFPLQESRRQTLTGTSLLSSKRRHSMAVPTSQLDKTQQSLKYLQKRRDSSLPQHQDGTGSSKNIAPTLKKRYRGRLSSFDFDDDIISEPGDVNEEDQEEEPSEEKDEFFGEEFYLSDQKNHCKGHLKNIKAILKRKKKDLQIRREEAKRQREERAKNMNIKTLPELPKLNPEDLEAFRMHNETIKMPDELPTLEEFIKLLKSDEYYDPRYKNKVRLKSKKIAQRYYIAKGQHRTSVMFSIGNIPDEIKNINTFRRGSHKQSFTPVSKQTEQSDCKSKGHNTRISNLQEPDQHRGSPPQLQDSKGIDSMINIDEQGQEVLGVTDSEPCKDHYISSKKQSVVENKENDNVTHREKDNITPTLKSQNSIPCLKSPIFPKIRTWPDDEIESSDTDSYESSSSESSDENFDTKKLNLKYSIERLRKKRRSKVKKRGGFIEVLAKYYNMQNAISVFSKNSVGRSIKKGRLRAKAFGKKIQQDKQDEDEQFIIGKLKKFKFLDVRNKKKMNFDNIPQADFSTPKLELFQKHLNEALDKYVIRREIVVTDQTTFYNATTSVTFTKISCFHHKQRFMS